MKLPRSRWWLFWEADPTRIDPLRDAGAVVPRVLERGRLEDVRWLLDCVGKERIHQVLKERWHPELSKPTLAFWRAYFRDPEPWPEPPPFRRSSTDCWFD